MTQSTAQAVPPIGVFITPVTPLQQNGTTVWCTRTNKAAVIDPGGGVDQILTEITRRGLTLDQIWITHGHLDGAALRRDDRRLQSDQRAADGWGRTAPQGSRRS